MPAEFRAVNIARIRTSGGTQPRTAISQDVVDDYAASMRAGAHFPPVVVFQVGHDYWLADGFHRYYAAMACKAAQLDAEVKQGAQRDAVLFSVGANADHGLRRTNDDKRRAVLTLLNDPTWSKWSNRDIAERCHVSSTMVDNCRSNLTANGLQSETTRTYTDRHGNESQMDTSNIGHTRHEPSETDLAYDAMKRSKTTFTKKVETSEPDDPAGGDTEDTSAAVAEQPSSPQHAPGSDSDTQTISDLCRALRAMDLKQYGAADLRKLHDALLELNDRIETRIYAKA